jgi:hypothetical protein
VSTYGNVTADRRKRPREFGGVGIRASEAASRREKMVRFDGAEEKEKVNGQLCKRRMKEETRE